MCYDIFGLGLKTGLGIDGLGLEDEVAGFDAVADSVDDVGVAKLSSDFSGSVFNGYFLRIGFIKLSF